MLAQLNTCVRGAEDAMFSEKRANDRKQMAMLHACGMGGGGVDKLNTHSAKRAKTL